MVAETSDRPQEGGTDDDEFSAPATQTLADQLAQLTALENELNSLIERSGIDPAEFQDDDESPVPLAEPHDEHSTQVLAMLRRELAQVEAEMEGVPRHASPHRVHWLPSVEEECRLSEDGDAVDDDAEAAGAGEDFEQLLMENLRLRRELGLLQQVMADVEHGTDADADEGKEEEQAEDETEEAAVHDAEEMEELEAKVQRQQDQLVALRAQLAHMCADIQDMRQLQEDVEEQPPGDIADQAHDTVEGDGELDNPLESLARALARLTQLETDARRLQLENAQLEENLGELKTKEALLQRLVDYDNMDELEWSVWLEKVADPANALASKLVVFVDGLRPERHNVDFEALQTLLSLPPTADPVKHLTALYAYGVDEVIHDDANASHWYTHLIPEASHLSVEIVADMLELFIRFGNRVRYVFIGADTTDYLPLFKKAQAYGVDTATLYCDASRGVTVTQAGALNFGVAVEYMSDVFL
eukprot:GGOE01045312.1.p2 GENE.GGOE01045312.1~~GGOE01045312.1.p2  ORF type:complete len:474 (-),score=187.34 GGOE01045312.1:582-2003(-)